MMMSAIPQEFSSTTLRSAISSETTVFPVVDFRVTDTAFQAESTRNFYIREGVLIPRSKSRAGAKVIYSFSIQLVPAKEGYIAVSDACNITELEKTMGEAARSYLYSLVDELAWLQKHAENLSKPLCEELNRIQRYIRIV
jgi:hypothetical protein